MSPVVVVAMAVVGGLGAGVVFTRDPVAQAIVFSMFGLALALFFLILQAPDVALAQLVVGAIAYPMVLLLTVSKARGRSQQEDEDDDE